jgi:phage tail tape-measure protein
MSGTEPPSSSSDSEPNFDKLGKAEPNPGKLEGHSGFGKLTETTALPEGLGVAVGNTISGAATGALVGSVFSPVVGTVIGAAVGGLLGATIGPRAKTQDKIEVEK